MLGADALVLCTLASGEEYRASDSYSAPRPGPDEPVHVVVREPDRSTHLFDARDGRATRAMKGWVRVREAGLGYLLILPAMVVFGVFTFFPFIENFDLAAHKTPPYKGLPSPYVGATSSSTW